jgi:hypothetical protein
MKAALGGLLMLVSGIAHAQDITEASGAKLRVLDRLTGTVSDLVLANKHSQVFGRITVQLDACRYPSNGSHAEAFAHLTVIDTAAKDPVFSGWMVASSPALSALDHPRYDVWVLRCDVPDLVLPDVEEAPAEGDAPAEGEATDDGNG